jgi:hypothetical protein
MPIRFSYFCIISTSSFITFNPLLIPNCNLSKNIETFATNFLLDVMYLIQNYKHLLWDCKVMWGLLVFYSLWFLVGKCITWFVVGKPLRCNFFKVYQNLVALHHFFLFDLVIIYYVNTCLWMIMMEFEIIMV